MVSDNEILRIARYLNIDFSRFPFDDFKRGIIIEFEHGYVNPITNVTNDDLIMTGKIALSHLMEHPDYYNREYGLPAIEKELEKRDII